MWHRFSAARSVFCSLKMHHVVILAVAAFTAVQPGQSAAQPPAVALTQIGSPIWRPADFQLFSAPVEPDAAVTAISRALEPLQPLGPGEPYTTPHGPPYDTGLSTNAAAAGFVNRSVFPREVMAYPNGIFFAHLLLPDPGITGSSRDFASGPVIPNSLFPITRSVERWKDGALIHDPGPGLINVRTSDQPFDGSSHRFPFSWFWNRGADNLGNYEFRSSLRDAEGNGWDIVAPFRIVAELPPGDFNQDGTVDAADYVVWRNGMGTTYTPADYDTWRANFGRTAATGTGAASSATGAGVPEPSAVILGALALLACRMPGPFTVLFRRRSPRRLDAASGNRPGHLSRSVGGLRFCLVRGRAAATPRPGLAPNTSIEPWNPGINALSLPTTPR